MKTDADLKRRWVFEDRDSRRGGSGFEGVKVDEKPVGTEGFALPKKEMVKKKMFIDAEGGEEPVIKPGDGAHDQGQNLFLAIILAGFIILIGVLMATGVF